MCTHTELSVLISACNNLLYCFGLVIISSLYYVDGIASNSLVRHCQSQAFGNFTWGLKLWNLLLVA